MERRKLGDFSVCRTGSTRSQRPPGFPFYGFYFGYFFIGERRRYSKRKRWLEYNIQFYAVRVYVSAYYAVNSRVIFYVVLKSRSFEIQFFRQKVPSWLQCLKNFSYRVGSAAELDQRGNFVTIKTYSYKLRLTFAKTLPYSVSLVSKRKAEKNNEEIVPYYT